MQACDPARAVLPDGPNVNRVLGRPAEYEEDPTGQIEIKSPVLRRLLRQAGAEFSDREVMLNYKMPVCLPPPDSEGVSKTADYEIAKRCMDVIGSGLILLLCSPLFLVLAILIRATSKGPALFKQKRLGANGEVFWCYKFRTMVVNAEDILKANKKLLEQFEGNYKIKDDPRVTRVGTFLRKTSLDELPQFLNVFQGTMSLIGPRPIVPDEVNKYGIYADKMLSVKPGLGGLWQVCGRSDSTYSKRVMLDMIYVDHRSLWLDIDLLFRTAWSVVMCRGAY